MSEPGGKLQGNCCRSSRSFGLPLARLFDFRSARPTTETGRPSKLVATQPAFRDAEWPMRGGCLKFTMETIVPHSAPTVPVGSSACCDPISISHAAYRVTFKLFPSAFPKVVFTRVQFCLRSVLPNVSLQKLKLFHGSHKVIKCFALPKRS